MPFEFSSGEGRHQREPVHSETSERIFERASSHYSASPHEMASCSFLMSGILIEAEGVTDFRRAVMLGASEGASAIDCW